MGDFTEHVLFGFLTALAVSYLFKQDITLGAPEAIASSLGVLVGSVVPDIDHKNAYIHRAAKAFISIAAGVLSLVLLPFRIHQNFIAALGLFLIVYTASSAVNMRHRGFTHSFSFMAIISSMCVIFGVYVFSSVTPGIAVGLGILSHLMLDREFKLT